MGLRMGSGVSDKSDGLKGDSKLVPCSPRNSLLVAVATVPVLQRSKEVNLLPCLGRQFPAGVLPSGSELRFSAAVPKAAAVRNLLLSRPRSSPFPPSQRAKRLRSGEREPSALLPAVRGRFNTNGVKMAYPFRERPAPPIPRLSLRSAAAGRPSK